MTPKGKVMPKLPDDIETPIVFFANPFLQCTQPECGRRAVGAVGVVAATGEIPTVNWPCYHDAGRLSVCDNWTSTTGCQHETEQRAEHSLGDAFEGTRR